LTARDFIEDGRRLWRGTCPTRLAVYHATCGFFALLAASLALLETAALAVAIPAPAGAAALILPLCWLIPASIGIHRSKAWTREWESQRGWWRKGNGDGQNRPPEDDLPPSPPPRRPSAPARQKEMEEA
jgi:hypothetical protein